MIYILIITFLLLIYALVALHIERLNSTRWVNLAFFLIIYVSYVAYVLWDLILVGPKSIYFYGVLLTANVSPFMFSILPLIYFSRGRLKRHLCLLVSLLSIGMLLSPVLNAITYAVCKYPFMPLPILDYVAHLSLSLWGIYLVKSGEVKPNRRDSIISASIIIGVALIMLLLNLVLDTSFFGLSLRGKHNIYGNVLVESSILSALIYFSGLTAVLLLGYAFLKCMRKEQSAIK